MPVLQLLVILAVIGFLLWCVNKWIPMADGWKNAINIIVAIATVLWLLSLTGLLSGLNNMRVGHIH